MRFASGIQWKFCVAAVLWIASSAQAIGLGDIRLGMPNEQVKKLVKLECRALEEPKYSIADRWTWKGVPSSRISCEAPPLAGVPESTPMTLTFDESGRLVSIWVGFVASMSEFARLKSAIDLPQCSRDRQVPTGDAYLGCTFAPDEVLEVKWDSDGCRIRCRGVARWQHWTVQLSKHKVDFKRMEAKIRFERTSQEVKQRDEDKRQRANEKARLFSTPN